VDVTRWTPTGWRNLLEDGKSSFSAGGCADQTHCGPEHCEVGTLAGIGQSRMKMRRGDAGRCVVSHGFPVID
jgi:hypothetical protein